MEVQGLPYDSRWTITDTLRVTGMYVCVYSRHMFLHLYESQWGSHYQ